MTVSTSADVRSAAELERRRLARQAAKARASAQAKAQETEAQTEIQARQAISETERQAQTARAEVQEKAETRQAEIRKQRGQVEREAQAAMAKAREISRKEDRKAVLPFTKPRDLGTASYIASVESVRRQAQKTGEDAKVAVTKVRDDYFEQVDKWQAEAKADIDKQLKDIQAEIAKSVVNAEAEIAKQQAEALSGIKDWETKATAEIEDFETNNVKLDTGEWVSTDTFNQLPPDYQETLKAVGVDAFNKKVNAEIADFEATNIEIKPDVWVTKDEWSNLSPTQQEEVKATGQYTIIPKDGDEVFNQLKTEGKIPDNAILDDYDSETGEVTYTALKTSLSTDDIMKYWNELSAAQQQIQINGALGKNVRVHYKDFNELTDKERDEVMKYYTQSMLPYQTKDTQFFKDTWEQQKIQLKDAAIGLIPVYGTIYHWDKMSPTWRGISIALDIITVIPLIKAAGQGIKAAALAIKTKISPIKTAATTLAKAEVAASDDMARILRQAYSTPTKVSGVSTLNRELANSYTDMMKAQSNYLQKLADQAELLRKGKVVPAKLQTAIVGTETKLRIAASNFVSKLYNANSQLRGIKDIPVRFDSPEIVRLMNSLPTEMVQNSKMAIAALQLKSTNIKALTGAVNTAEAALKAAQTKYPTDPSKWVDLMYELTKAQGRLAQAKAGSVNTLYENLLKARSAGKVVEAAKLERQLANAVNSMEVEWGRLGFNTGGRVGVITTKPLSPPSVAPPKAPAIGTKIPVSQAAARVVTLLSSTDAETLQEWATAPGTISTPEVVEAAREIARTLPKVKGVTTPEVIALTEAALRESIKASLEGKTAEEIRAQTIDAVKPIIEEWLDTATITQTEAKAMTSTAVKTATKVATDLKLTSKIKRTLAIPEAKGADKRPKYPRGTIAWKMGETKRGDEWKIIPPPYTLLKPISSTTPPRGVRKTKGTPQETLTFIGGKMPFKNVSFDLGVTDGFIDVKARTIKFTGEGEKTDVGTRRPETTKGISLTDNPPLLQQLTKPKGKRHGKQGQGRSKMTLTNAGTPRKHRLVSHGVYTDKQSVRITRKRKRGWKRIY